ncbi:MAG: endonuclease III [Simkania negevensis]|nr:endonuclease III [Simkania negevensis]
MNKIERTKIVQSYLEKLFPEPKIFLTHKDPYTLLIAVLLSAQCTDLRVNTITPKLFAMADSPEKMAELPLETIENIIRPCGLWKTKAQAIKKLSKILLEEYGGEVPCSIEELEKLPGVGHKTASVVMVQAFHKPAFPVDTHIHRCAKRWGLSNGRSVEETEKDLKKLFPNSSWSSLHLQIIFYARKYCPARGHDLSLCPICKAISSKKST